MLLPLPQALSTYKGYLTRIATNMAALEEQHRGGARSEVVATLLELGGFIERICMLRPRDLWCFYSSDLETGQRAAGVQWQALSLPPGLSGTWLHALPGGAAHSASALRQSCT